MDIINKYGHCSYSFEEDYVHIYNLFILPQFRRQGKARELLKLAISSIRNTGYDKTIKIVAIPQDNSITIEDLTNFYEKLGLKVFTYYG